jgi:lactoylglutathione lyase
MEQAISNSITGVRTIGVPVRDQDQALRFYTEKLGFETRLDLAVEQFGGRWIEVAPPGAATTIALVPARDGMPGGVETGLRLTTPDAAAMHRDLHKQGVVVGELVRWPGVPTMFAICDQDGNGLAIIEQTASPS